MLYNQFSCTIQRTSTFKQDRRIEIRIEHMQSDLSLPGTVSCSVGMLKVMHWDKESYQTGKKFKTNWYHTQIECLMPLNKGLFLNFVSL